MPSPLHFLFLLSAILCPTLSSWEVSPDVTEKVQASVTFISEYAKILTAAANATLKEREKHERRVTALLSPFGQGAAKRRAGKALSFILKGMNIMAKIGTAFATVGPFISFILALIPQEEKSEVALMKKQFVEVNRKLDSIALQVASLQATVKWTCYASVYSQDENRIENSWAEFAKFMRKSQTAKTQEERKRLQEYAQRFISFYRDTATASSVASFYRYLTQDEPSLNTNLFNILADEFKGNLTAVVQYSHHFTAVMLKGLQLNLYYYVLKGHNGEDEARESAQKLSQVVQAQQSAVLTCIQNYQKWVRTDVKTIGEKTAWQNSRDLALNLKAFLDEKYYWHDWVVVVYGEKESGHSEAGQYIKVTIQDRIVVLFSRERGAGVDADTKRQIQDQLHNLQKERTIRVASGFMGGGNARKCVSTDLIDVLRTETETNPRISGLHAGQHTDMYFKTEDSGYAEVTCSTGPLSWDQTVTYTVFLEGKEVSPPPCSQSCGRGTCTVIKGTSGEFCKCEKDFYGEKCESSVLDEVRWEKFESGVGQYLSQPVPELTSTQCKIAALTELIKALQEKS